jgi:hypothetical protein
VRPWGRVTLDDKDLGDTPLEMLTVPAGVHRIRIRHPSYEVWEQEVTVQPGQTHKLFVDLPAQGKPRRP